MGWLAGLLDISLAAANRLYTWGWGLSVSGAAVTMLGVGMLWLGTRVRDHDFDEQIGHLHSRAASSEERAASLSKDAANIQLALERERIARLQLEEKQKILETYQAQRVLTDFQKKTLIDALSPLSNQVVILEANVGDDDGIKYANDFLEVFRAAKWRVKGDEVSRAVMSVTPVGVGVRWNKELADANLISRHLDVLLTVLGQLDIIPKPATAFSDAETPKGEIGFFVGVKPRLEPAPGK
jgi:hypothetical protein